MVIDMDLFFYILLSNQTNTIFLKMLSSIKNHVSIDIYYIFNLSDFMKMQFCFYYYISVVELELRYGDSSISYFIVQDCFIYLGLFVFPYDVQYCPFSNQLIDFFPLPGSRTYLPSQGICLFVWQVGRLVFILVSSYVYLQGRSLQSGFLEGCTIRHHYYSRLVCLIQRQHRRD